MAKLPKNARLIVELDNGSKVRLRGVSTMLIAELEQGVLDRWADEGRQMTPAPTYTITTAAGVEEIHAHDSASISEIQDEAERAAVLAQLHKSQADEIDYRRQRTMSMIDLAALECVEVIEGPAIEQWEKRRKMLGRHVPTDPDERQLAYVKEYILTTTRDMTTVITGMLEVSGVSKESVDTATANFRSEVEGRTEAGGSADQAAEVDIRAGESVLGAAGREGLGVDAQAVLES